MYERRRWERTALLAAGLALLAGCSTQAGAAAGGSGPSRSVTATATGTADGTPDMLQADVAIANGGSSAAQVLRDNNAKTQELLLILKAEGVDDKDVSTTSVNLGPTYDKDGDINGYAATNSLQVKLRDLKTAGATLDAVVEQAGDRVRINSVSLGFNDDDKILATARADAVTRAKDQAEVMAKAGGAKVGKVRTITEVAANSVYPMADYSLRQMNVADSSVPIAPGSQELSVQVKVVFELS